MRFTSNNQTEYLRKDMNSMQKYLTLADGTTFTGVAFGATNALAAGEVVFNTGMTGYQEAITDPSYTNQLLTFTYPLIGTYGINLKQNQAPKASCQAVIIRHLDTEITHHDYQQSLNNFLANQQIPGIADIDTRALTKHIRVHGTMQGILSNEPITAADFPSLYKVLAKQLDKQPCLEQESYHPLHADYHVVLLDFGIKHAIIQQLLKQNCAVTVLPYQTDFATIAALDPDGIFVSNGPDDPTAYPDSLPLLQQLEHHYPMAGICLGHQLLALANGAKTYALPFGHRGQNHPVKLLASGHTIMTSQNHGYAVAADSLAGTGLKVTAIEGNDNTVEGLAHTTLPIITVQYHPEANPGPLDGQIFFHEFKQLMAKEVLQHA